MTVSDVAKALQRLYSEPLGLSLIMGHTVQHASFTGLKTLLESVYRSPQQVMDDLTEGKKPKAKIVMIPCYRSRDPLRKYLKKVRKDGNVDAYQYWFKGCFHGISVRFCDFGRVRDFVEEGIQACVSSGESDRKRKF